MLACKQSKSFKRELETAWLSDVPDEDTIVDLGNKLVEMGIVTQCIERIQQEVDLSIEALGEYAHKPGCQEIAQWALAMCHRFQVLESA